MITNSFVFCCRLLDQGYLNFKVIAVLFCAVPSFSILVK